MVEDKKVKKTNEEVHELYKIEKNGKEKIVETSGTIEEENPEKIKKQRSEESKVLIKILLFIGFLLLIVFFYSFITRASNQFKYEGVKFTKIHEGQLVFYQTSFPVIYNGSKANFNIYLRNDPRKLEQKVAFPTQPIPLLNTVINITQEFDCNGDQIIAIANVANIYSAIGKKIMKDENASCDSQGRYMYIVLQPANKTSVEKFGPQCYNININNCEILEGTERFIVGMLVSINSK